jgi:hypothetical protein
MMGYQPRHSEATDGYSADHSAKSSEITHCFDEKFTKTNFLAVNPSKNTQTT